MNDLNSLFNDSGLDDAALDALARAGQDQDLGTTIMAGLGDIDVKAVKGLKKNQVLCVRLLIDDSSSISYRGNTQHVIDGHNRMLDALLGSKASGATLISTQYLNEPAPLYPFMPLDQAIRMGKDNFFPSGQTPLYDMTAASLATVAAKQAELEDGGIAFRSATYIVTDGEDIGSRMYLRPEDVEPIVTSMLAQESHIVGAMGIDDGATDFREVFRRMGIPDRWILTPGNNPTEIRRGFDTFSQSATQVSVGAGSFSEALLGGFGTNNQS